MCSMPQTFAGHAVPLPRALPLLEEVKLCGFTAVDIFGGEIMLRLDLPVLIELAKRLNLYVMIISTGYGIDEASLGRMVEAGLDKIEIAIDAPNAELHDFIKGRRGLFDHAVRAVRAARENPRVYVEVNTVVLPENFRYLPQLHRFIASELHGHRQHLFYVTHPPSSLVRPRWLDEAQAREYFEVVKPELERIEAELGTHIDFCPSVEPGDFASPEALYKNFSRGCYLGESRRCAAPEQDLMVLPDGEVYACNSPMVIHSQTAIGNMATHRLIDCLSGGPMARWLREAGTWPECESCIARR